MNIQTIKTIVGHFLDAMKFAAAEESKLAEVGIRIKAIGMFGDKAWDSIKLVTGMPGEDEISDNFYDYAFFYVHNKLSRDEAINRIIGWKKVIKGDQDGC